MIKIQTLQLGKPRIKALVYGPPGVGKTTLLATADDHPDMKGILVANVDGGLISIASRGGILEAPIASVADLEELHSMAARGAPEFAGVQTIAIDSGSELYEAHMREISAREHSKDPRGRPMDTTEIQDYGEATARLTRVIRWFRDLPFHVIMTSLDKADRQVVDTRKRSKQQANVLAVYPKFPDKLCTSIMATFDFVWYLAIKQDGERGMMTQPNGIVVAKTRGPDFARALGPVVSNPNLGSLYATLLETEGKAR